MKTYIYRLNTPRVVAILCALAFVGLISLLFQPSIAALVKSLAPQRNSMTAGPGRQEPGGADKPVIIVTTAPTATRTTGRSSGIPPARGIGSPSPARGMIVAQDTFQRTDQIFWGTASDGQKWMGDANASTAFAISDHSGHMLFAQSIYNALLGPKEVNTEVVVSGLLSSFQNTNLGVVLRWQNQNSWYKAYIDGTELILLKDVGGVMTRLSAIPYAAFANQSHTLRFRAVGSQLQVRVWATRDAEPATWQLQSTDQDLPEAGFGGLRVLLGSGDEAIFTGFTERTVPV